MKKDLTIFLCHECKKELKNYNPYIYPMEDDKMITVPLNKIEVVEVMYEHCENSDFNCDHKPQLWKPIFTLDDTTDEPWILKGQICKNSTMCEYSSYTGFNEAFRDALYRYVAMNNAHSFEIHLRYKDGTEKPVLHWDKVGKFQFLYE